MKHDNVKFFFVTDNNYYWSKGDTFVKAFQNLKSFTSRPCKCVVIMTTDEGAYVDQISGGVCAKTDELTQEIGFFKMSQGRLSPIEKPE